MLNFYDVLLLNKSRKILFFVEYIWKNEIWINLVFINYELLIDECFKFVLY